VVWTRGPATARRSLVATVGLALLAILAAGCTPEEAAPPTSSPSYTDGKVVVRDSFDRQVKDGWGEADLGGAYLIDPGPTMSVSDGVGRMVMPRPGIEHWARLSTAKPRDLVATVDVVLGKIPTRGSGTYLAIDTRSDGFSFYQLGLRVKTDRKAYLSLTRYDGTPDAKLPLAPETVVATKLTDGAELHLRLRVAGVTPVEIGASLTTGNTPAPDKSQVAASDASASRLVAGGAFEMSAYASKSTPGPQTITFDNLQLMQLLEGPA